MTSSTFNALTNPAVVAFMDRAFKRGDGPCIAQSSRSGITWVVTSTVIGIISPDGSEDVYPLAQVQYVGTHTSRKGVSEAVFSTANVSRRFVAPKDEPTRGSYLAHTIEDRIARAARKPTLAEADA